MCALLVVVRGDAMAAGEAATATPAPAPVPSPTATAPRSPSAAPTAAPAAVPATAPASDPWRTARAALDEAQAAGARTGLAVLAADTGEVLFAHGADDLLNPASNVKLFTTAAALARFGPAYRFATDVLADAAPAGGVVQGNLYVRGTGDPRLVTEEAFAMTAAVAARGVTRVTGRLVIDDTYFDQERLGAGWEQQESDHPYLAPVGALSVNFNSVNVRVGPGAKAGAPAFVSLEPPSDDVDLVNEARTKAGGRRRLTVSSIPAPRRSRILVRGRLPLGSDVTQVARRIHDPPQHAGAVLRYLLKIQGVTIDGPTEQGRTPDAAVLLSRHSSPRLSQLVADINKFSNNFMAEQLLKALGAHVFGAPGTWEKGLRVVADFLEAELGMARDAYTMRNGSGLNDVNRFTAMQLARLLVRMRAHTAAPEFASSLAIAAVDGTMRRRLDETTTAQRLRAKTGSLAGVASLSGYATSADGRTLAFAVIMNGFRGGARRVWAIQDAIAASLVALEGARPAGVSARPGMAP
jgi:D-alanyl-D-alanine carboxypeptidase/D-alanyl-D-alanine-endopeptidase (penicillin-binding protein 4)